MGLLNLLVLLVVAAAIIWLVFYVIDRMGVPEPLGRVIKIIVGIVLLVYLLGWLLGYTPSFRIGG